MGSQEADSGGLDLRALLGAIRRRAWLVILCVLIAAGSAYGLSALQEKEYSASASLLFRDPAFDSQIFGAATSPSQDPAREAATNVDLVSLQIVADRTARQVGETDGDEVSSHVEIETNAESNVVSVTATDTDPDFAADLANEYADQYVGFRREADRAQVTDALELAEERYAALTETERTGEKGDELQKQISRLETLGALQTGNAELVQPARPPDSPSSPAIFRNTVLGGVVGLLIGLVLALLAERLDRRLRSPDEIADAFSMPLLGTIPLSAALVTGEGSSELPARESEAFRMLRGRLRFFDVDKKVTSVLVTSAEPFDGKSTVAWNLALTAASVGSRTILLECDFHQPSIAERHGLAPLPGLAEHLTAQAELPIQQVSITNRANGSEARRHLDVVVAGTTPPNSVELMESNKMTALLSVLGESYDLVVLDAPPAMLVADVIPLLRQVGGVAVVAEPGRTTREAADALVEELKRQHAPVLGVVANKVRSRAAQGYYHYAVASVRVGDQRNPDGGG